MCISIKSSRPLNPSAKEWAPPSETPFYPLPSNSQPPHAAFQMVALAPPPPCKLHYPFQGFIPYGGPCILPTFSTYLISPSFPEAAPPLVYGGEPNRVQRPVVQNRRRRNIPVARMWRCLGGGENYRRPEWRPKKCVGGGGATTSPPRVSAPPFVKMSSSPKTTVMIKNLPNQLRRDYMLELLDSYCKAHSLEYDFFYLPMDFSKENNLGYAFVNFTSARGAIKLKKVLHNYEWGTVTTHKGTFTSRKICEVAWATTQGKEGQIKRFEESVFACDKVEFLPVVFDPPRNGSNGDVARPVTVGKLRK